MPSSHTQAFLDALHTLERDGDTEPLAALSAAGGTYAHLTAPGEFRGPDGARKFWSADRGLFESVASEFRAVVEDGDSVALEWTRTGTGRGGDAVDYAGVSVIEFADGEITRFRAYYDPTVLGDQAL